VILWRIGSLRHMFSSMRCAASAQDGPHELPMAVTAPDYFTVAVAALQLVRDVRPRTGAFDQVVSASPDDSLFLMQHGLYSDTHVLTLPFIGELAVCAQRIGHACAPALQQHGREALQLYIQACDGPLREQGWSSQEAASNMRLLA
jgi:hypothetical protein